MKLQHISYVFLLQKTKKKSQFFLIWFFHMEGSFVYYKWKKNIQKNVQKIQKNFRWEAIAWYLWPYFAYSSEANHS